MANNSYDLQLNKNDVIAITALTPALIILTAVIIALGLRKTMPTERTIKNLEWVGWNVGMFSGLAVGIALSYNVAGNGIGMGIIDSNSGKGIDIKLLYAAGILSGSAVGLIFSGLFMFLLSSAGKYLGKNFMPQETRNENPELPRADEEASISNTMPMFELLTKHDGVESSKENQLESSMPSHHHHHHHHHSHNNPR